MLKDFNIIAVKRIIIAIVAIVALCGVAQAQRHIEFRWHGVYLVGDVAYGANLNRAVEEGAVVGDTLSAVMPTFTVGYQFRKEAGVGLGFSYVADPTGAYTQLPLFVELRSHYMRSQLTPYTVLQVGYTMPLGMSSTPNPIGNKIEEGGLYVGIEVGGRYALSRTTAVALHASYRLLQSNKVLRTDIHGTSLLAPPVVLNVVGGGVSFYFSN